MATDLTEAAAAAKAAEKDLEAASKADSADAAAKSEAKAAKELAAAEKVRNLRLETGTINICSRG